ncbi:MAG TPA: hypothetical protein VFM18_01105, partial [Methanosarcina sp.]|nr:hypothetical protein [Methanosarcina sp.]
MAIQVQAIREGYYGNVVRQEGEIFSINSANECGLWMHIIDKAAFEASAAQIKAAAAAASPAAKD